jgi:O-antigen/teichoic acid export membrane protein
VTKGLREWGGALGRVAAGNLLQQMSMFAAGVLVARELGPEGYGEYSFVQSTVAFLSVFAGFGLPQVLTLGVARERGSGGGGETIGNGLALGMGLAMAVGVTAAVVGTARPEWLRWEGMDPRLLWAAVALLAGTTAYALLAGVGAGFEAFGELARSAGVRGGVSLPLLAAGAMGWGVSGALWGGAAAVGIAGVDLWRRVRRLCAGAGIGVRVTGRVGPMLRGGAAPLFAASVLSVPVTWYCNRLLLGTEQGTGELGIFSATGNFRTVLAFVPAVVGQVLLPRMARGRSGRRAMVGAAGLSGLTAVGAGVVFVAGQEYLMAMYGARFGGRVELFGIVIATGIVFAAMAPLGHAMVGAGRLWANAGVVAAGAAAQTAGAHAWIGSEGAEGLAKAVLAGCVTQLALLTVWVWRYEGGAR